MPQIIKTFSTAPLPFLPRYPRKHGGIGRCNECRSIACKKNWNADDVNAVQLSLVRDA